MEKKSAGARAERWAGGGRLKAKGPALDTDLPGYDMSLSDSLPPKESQVERQFYLRATVKGTVCSLEMERFPHFLYRVNHYGSRGTTQRWARWRNLGCTLRPQVSSLAPCTSWQNRGADRN